MDTSCSENDANGGWTAYPPLSGLVHAFGFSNVEMNQKKFVLKKFELNILSNEVAYYDTWLYVEGFRHQLQRSPMHYSQ